MDSFIQFFSIQHQRRLRQPNDNRLESGQGIITCIALAVCGVSTGLGAVFMNLRQRNPAAIVSGFGGTLNLVLCLGFMLLTILPFGILFHLNSTNQIPATLFSIGLKTASVWLVLLTTLTTIIPLKVGLRSLENRDY